MIREPCQDHRDFEPNCAACWMAESNRLRTGVERIFELVSDDATVDSTWRILSIWRIQGICRNVLQGGRP